ncbi:hypothetical protein COOONC_22254, partial [Cooperia oncophora]
MNLGIVSVAHVQYQRYDLRQCPRQRNLRRKFMTLIVNSGRSSFTWPSLSHDLQRQVSKH